MTTIHLSLVFSNVYHFACVWPTALKLGCITKFDTFFLVMGFSSLVDEVQFIIISSLHICIRSIISPFLLVFLICLLTSIYVARTFQSFESLSHHIIVFFLATTESGVCDLLCIFSLDKTFFTRVDKAFRQADWLAKFSNWIFTRVFVCG